MEKTDTRREHGDYVSASAGALPVGSLLDLLGAGVSGPILAALSRRPLRTRSLTERISGCAPRTVYRHASRLADCGLVVREEQSGVPSTVTYRLSDQGRELFRLLDDQANKDLAKELHGAETWWSSLALLGEMWSTGWIAELSLAAVSPTELSEITAGMSFHQVNRRVHLLRSRNILHESAHAGRGRRYRLSNSTRRQMGLVAGIGRWRERHGLVRKQHGLTAPETATALRVALPLVKLDVDAGAQIKLGVVGAPEAGGGRGSELLLVKAGRDGYLRCLDDSDRPADAWALGTTDLWLSALVEGNRGRMRTGGDTELLDACLAQLRTVLWNQDKSVTA